MVTPLTGVSNAGGVGRNRDSEPISAPLRAVNAVPPELWHLLLVVSARACWWRETTTKCLWREVSTRLHSMLCTIEANYWQTRSIAWPLCESRACYNCEPYSETWIL